MDMETASLIDELRHPGAALLLELLDGDQTEDHLRGAVPGLSQSAINRKLQRLADRHLIDREPGSKQQKGLRWRLVSRDGTHKLLAAANTLARLSLEAREEEVAETDHRLRRSRNLRRLRDVSNGAREG
jgi:DNA-binding HxlR family transcriptional regulator